METACPQAVLYLSIQRRGRFSTQESIDAGVGRPRAKVGVVVAVSAANPRGCSGGRVGRKISCKGSLSPCDSPTIVNG